MNRIQCKLSKGWRMPAGAVYVGRPSKWGNPFSIEDAMRLAHTEDEEIARMMAVELFRNWLDGKMPYFLPERSAWIRAHYIELRGHDLVCWCPLLHADGYAAYCHADVLIEWARGKESIMTEAETASAWQAIAGGVGAV